MSDSIDMKAYCDEILRRFPEIRENCELDDDDDDSVTEMLWYVVWWLRDLGVSGITSAIEQRVVSFARWCEEQPRGETAADDLLTKFVVSFFEDLFAYEATRPLIPKICDYGDMIRNAEYLKQWVGEGDYELALKEFPNQDRKRKPKRRKRLGSRKRQ